MTNASHSAPPVALHLVSVNIYFPAPGSMAMDLDVSQSQLNLTITSYMVRNPSRYGIDDTDIGTDT